MCYNNMYAHKDLEVGTVAISRAGHDSKRLYLVITVLSSEFVLCCDGALRGIDKPKLKRIKHLKPLGKVDINISQNSITDEQIAEILKGFLPAVKQ